MSRSSRPIGVYAGRGDVPDAMTGVPRTDEAAEVTALRA